MKKLWMVPLGLAAAIAGAATGVVQDQCGPFTDVSPALCPYVFEMYALGITAGTSPTTYSPDAPMTRGQAAVFVSKGVNQAIARSSRRAALGQWWTTTPHYQSGLGVSPVGDNPDNAVSDGQDVWVTSFAEGTVTRVRASDGRVLETWTPGGVLTGIVSAMGKIFVTSSGQGYPLWRIDPALAPGSETIVAEELGTAPQAIAFDGARFWTANLGGSISIVTPSAQLPWSVQTLTEGFSTPRHVLFDGTSVWVADGGSNALLRLNGSGAVAQTVPLDGSPGAAVFDGENIWVPESPGSIALVRASSGAVVTRLSGNGLSFPFGAAFDGERVLVTNPGANSVSLWSAADLSPLGTFSTGANDSYPTRVCSDGLNFWILLLNPSAVARF